MGAFGFLHQNGPFLTMNFEFDQDLGPRPGPKLAKNARKKVDKRTIVSSNYFEAAVLMNIPNNSDT